MLDDAVFAEQIEALRAELHGESQVCNAFIRITLEATLGLQISLEIYNLDVITCDLCVRGGIRTGRGADVDSAYESALRNWILGMKGSVSKVHDGQTALTEIRGLRERER